MNQFGVAVKNLFAASEDRNENNNILETSRHSEPIFEKIDPAKYFRITVSEWTTTTFSHVYCKKVIRHRKTHKLYDSERNIYSIQEMSCFPASQKMTLQTFQIRKGFGFFFHFATRSSRYVKSDSVFKYSIPSFGVVDNPYNS